MQARPVSWTTDGLTLAPRSLSLFGGPAPFGGALQRCQRCDIPLGSSPCPNPECCEPHGQRAGDLCTWCHHKREEQSDGIDWMSLPTSAEVLLPCASACVD